MEIHDLITDLLFSLRSEGSRLMATDRGESWVMMTGSETGHINKPLVLAPKSASFVPET